jgi:hypothetical protein
MLDGYDIQTFHSLRQLEEVIQESIKPLLFWIGAGASSWCDYPRWDELADNVHSKFLKTDPTYNKRSALDFINAKQFPEFFQLCKNVNSHKYFSDITDLLKPKPITPVYSRFLETIQSISPLYIVTTNVDEALENNLRRVRTVQRSDFERCIDLIQQKQSFVCKLHGSVSSVESMVFTTHDYNSLIKDKHYLELLRHIFAQTSVVFIGYGLGDKYLIDSLLKVQELKGIFGSGPHFAVVPSTLGIPDFVKPLRYKPIPHKDHRSALQVLDEIYSIKKSSIHKVFQPNPIPQINLLKSAHLISDIYPPGKWSGSSQLNLSDGSFCIEGDGLTTSELPLTHSTAMHDLIVGLLCFDTVYIPFPALQRVHHLIGSELFWELVKTNTARFIYWTKHEFIHQPNLADNFGSLISASFPEMPMSEQLNLVIRNFLVAAPGKEKEAENLFKLLENKIEILKDEDEPEVSSLTRGILLRQSVRNLIGMSGGTSLSSIPPWMTFPVLRLTNVVKIGTACRLLGIASTKLEYGATKLAGPAFAASLGNEWADDMASYTLTGQFGTDIGTFALQNPSVFFAVLKFRESSAGIAFRKEVFDQLSLRHGADFVTSINAGLNEVIPTKVLKSAREKLAGLLMAEEAISGLTPAIWNNYNYSNKALQLWKYRSLQTLREYCRENNITQYDYCPCNSGEKLKFCCEESLTRILR